jgi:dihydroorotase
MSTIESPDTITLIRPDDWHLHLRDGAHMASVLPHTARQFARAIVMPNLKPPVTTAADAAAYRERILAALPQGMNFEPLMTLYLTDNTDPDEIRRAQDTGFIHAVKLYPAGATTNSAAGVTDLRKCYKTLEVMQELDMPLLVHGEVTDHEIDLFDREAVFIERVMRPLRRDFPELKIVFEHITTKARSPPPSRPTTCCTTATRSSRAGSTRTTTACLCSSARNTAWRW